MLDRLIQKRLEDGINHTAAVVLLGVRQIGKTTLAQRLAAARSALYLDLEDAEDASKLADAKSFLLENRDKLIVLDEIQRLPNIFMTLRGIIDKNRREGHANGQFLLLGSASMDLLRQSAESLAGRVHYLSMTGLNTLEVGEENRQKLWLRGGFPQSFLAMNDDLAMVWLEDLIKTYLERELPQMGFSIPAIRLRRLWTMLAHLQGETINCAKLAENLEVSSKTISHYIDILTNLLLVRRIEPWYANVKKRLVKSPRFYVRDSGLLHRLLGILDYNSLLSNPILGKSWEGFVVENIHSVLPELAESYFYRTTAGAEIDLLIKMPNAQLWAVEIKYGSSPKLNQHFHQSCLDAGATHSFVIYGGDDEFPIGNDTRMISLTRFMTKLLTWSP